MMPQRKSSPHRGRDLATKQPWREWITAFGLHVRRVREFLGLSQEQVARAAGVSQGAVSRFEGGRGLSTPFVGIMKIVLALAHALKQIDPELLSDDLRAFLHRNLEVFELPDVMTPETTSADATSSEVGPPSSSHFARFALAPNPELARVLKLYHELPESKRPAFLSVMEATITAIRDS